MKYINHKARIQETMPIYAYLKYRSASDIPLTRRINQMHFDAIATELSIPLPMLSDEMIFALEIEAIKRAKEIWPSRFGLRVFDKTPEERELIKLLQQEFDPTSVAVRPEIQGRGNYVGGPFILGPFIPDAIAIGLRTGTKKFVCTTFEVDGSVHDWKMENDELYEAVLGCLEISVKRFDSDQIKNSWKFCKQVKSSIVALKEFNKCRSDERAILKVKRHIALFNIATWLSFNEMEAILKLGFGCDFHLEKAFVALKQRDCPNRIKYLPRKIRIAIHGDSERQARIEI